MQQTKHLFLSVLLPLLSLVAQAQHTQASLHPLPMDTAIHYGVLPNGLTYYICRTQTEKNSANLYLLQRSGSAHESSNAHGVAHFVEHMAMRGTKHFPEQTAFNYLRSIGVHFGIDVNAFTSADRTLYLIPHVLSPTGGRLDSCLLLLSDWSSEVTFEPDLVVRERSIILEEERMRHMDANVRREMNLYQTRLAGSPYAHLPIGDMKVVEHCTPNILRDYYERWYQPQLQAVVVVGDVDVQEVEERIMKHFGKRQRGDTAPSTPALPLHTQPQVFEVPYPALPYASLVVSMTKSYHSQGFYQSVEGLIDRHKHYGMLDDLRDSLRLWQDSSGLGISHVAVDAWPNFQGINVAEHLNLNIRVKPEHWRTALIELLTKLEHWRRHGMIPPIAGDTIQLTDSQALAMVGELPLTSKTDKLAAEDILKRCMAHFNGQALISDESMEALQTRLPIGKMVTARGKHFATYYKPEHTEIIVYYPTDSAIVKPTSAHLLALYDSISTSSIAPYDTITAGYHTEADSTAQPADSQAKADAFVNLRMPFPLSPVAGQLAKRKVSKHKLVEYHLSNGVRVVHLPDTANLRLIAFRYGGLSRMADADVPAALFLEQVSRNFGTYFSNLLWENPPSIRTKSINNAMDSWEIVGSDNLEALLQAAHLFFTSAVVDSVKVAQMQQELQFLRNTLEQEPSFQARTFQDEHHYINTNRRANRRLYSDMLIDQATLERLLQEHRSNYNGLTVLLSGALKPKHDLPLILKYLGSLPSKAEPYKVTKHLADHYKPYNDTVVTHITHTEPLAISYVTLHQEDDFVKDYVHLAHAQVFGPLLKDALMERIRFEQGLVYAFDVDLHIERYITDFQNFTLHFTCHPKDYNHILTLIEQTLKSLPTHPLLTEEWLQQRIAKLVAYYDQNQQEFELQAQCDYYHDGERLTPTQKEAYQQITIDSLRQFIHSWLKHSRRYVSTYTNDTN